MSDQERFEDMPPELKAHIENFAVSRGFAPPRPDHSMAVARMTRLPWWRRGPLARRKWRKQIREIATQRDDRATTERTAAARLREEAATANPESASELLRMAATRERMADALHAAADELRKVR